MTKHKHLTLSERLLIEKGLNERMSFRSIARSIGKDNSTISKEIHRHIVFKKSGAFGRAFNDCANRFGCTLKNLCADPDCRGRLCRDCLRCHGLCEDYLRQTCVRLASPPYVCNGCHQRGGCTLEKRLYSAAYAHKEYEAVRTESRSGICVSEKEAAALDGIISPLVRQGHSVHHIYVNNAAEIMCCEKTIYNYIDYGVFSAKNIDLPRKVRYRPRKAEKNFKVDRACRAGRTLEDYRAFLERNPDCPVVQMDSVEGSKGGKVLLTIHFVKSEFMLAFLRDRNTAASVHDIVEHLYALLTADVFSRLFVAVLADNGSEFSDPSSLETDSDGMARMHLFYCDASSPYQKGAIENNHEFIRRVLPKGTSFDGLIQKDIDLMMNHINSYARASLGDRTPYGMFSLLYGSGVLKALGADLIPPNEVILLPSLLK